jgi:hypothetical protein
VTIPVAGELMPTREDADAAKMLRCSLTDYAAFMNER